MVLMAAQQESKPLRAAWGGRVEVRGRGTGEYEENASTTNADDPLSSVPKIAFGYHQGRNWDHNQSHAPVRSRM
jgi:hypothetical protein